MDGSTVTPIAPSLRVTAWRSRAATRIPKRLMWGFSPAGHLLQPQPCACRRKPDALRTPVSGGLLAGGLLPTIIASTRVTQDDAICEAVGLDRVVLHVPDLEKSAGFYRGFFGGVAMNCMRMPSGSVTALKPGLPVSVKPLVGPTAIPTNRGAAETRRFLNVRLRASASPRFVIGNSSDLVLPDRLAS